MDHQIKAVEKLHRVKAFALFMDMGTGKTRTILEFIKKRKNKHKLTSTFWITPCSTKYNLIDEIQKHSNLSSAIIENYENEHICVIGTETISQSDKFYLKTKDLIEQFPKNMIVVDESHMIKNPKAIRTKRILDFQAKCKYRAILTGTPTPQGIWDLYTQFYFLHPKILGYNSFYSFATNHLEYSEKFPGMIVEAHNTDFITQKINPYLYQVTKDECLDLPEKSYTNQIYEMSMAQQDLYNQVKCIIIDQIDYDDFDSTLIFRLFTYLHRIVSGYIDTKLKNYGYGYQKIKLWDEKRARLLKDIISEINPKRNKIIIWHRYNSDIRLISKILPWKIAEINGNIKKKQREINVKSFLGGSINLLLINLATGSLGLNLQAANYMIYYNNTFDYAKRIQSEDRIYRIGQQKNCHIIDIICSDSIDAKIEQSILKKSSLSREIRQKINEIKDNPTNKKNFKKEILKEW